MAIDLKAHYERLIEEEYRSMERFKSRPSKVSIWLFAHGENRAKNRFKIFFNATCIGLAMGAVLLAWMLGWNPVNIHPQTYAVVSLVIAAAAYTLARKAALPLFEALKKHNASPADDLQLYFMEKYLQADPRLQSICVEILRKEGTNQLTSQQCKVLIDSCNRIGQWREQEEQRNKFEPVLEKDGLLSKARTRERGDSLSKALPTAKSPNARPPRF